MIICPECGKEIADDSAHCGYCGAQIESGAGKKTMIGMAPVTAEMMAKAAAEARAAREASEAAREAKASPTDRSGGDLISEGKLKIPKPNLPTQQEPLSSGLPSPDRLSVPRLDRPAEARQAPEEPSDPLSDARTEMLSSVGGAPSTIEERATPPFDEEPPTAPGNFAPDVAAPVDSPFDDAFKMSSTEPPPGGAPDQRANEPAWTAPAADETMPERVAPSAAGPTPGGGGGGGGADGPVVIAGNTLPKKKTNTALYAALAAVAFIGFCCIAFVLFGLLGF